MSKALFTEKYEDVLNLFETDKSTGLPSSDISIRQSKYGLNVLKEKGGRSPWTILCDQLKEVMVIILVIAAVVSFSLHEAIEGIVILVIVILNTLLGFWQEFKAEKAMVALKEMAEPNARVKRDGQEQTIPARELVPGDIIIVEAGNVIPADARITVCANLKVEEATLTGESEPVEKSEATLEHENTPLAERVNMLYMGTIVTYGRGEAVVCATGMKTELGNIASMLQGVDDEKTPLQKRLDKLGKKLAGFAMLLIAVVALLSYFRGLELKEIFMTAISIAVAAIPEGLPAVVTIALALGARTMLAKKALIRNLPAVETLGSVTVICSDKTGTLTKNEMTVTDVLLADQDLSIDEIVSRPAHIPTAQLALLCGTLCNDAAISHNENNDLSAIGDPTEGSLVVAAHKANMIKQEIEGSMRRIAEFPFDSERKRMSTVHALPQNLPAAPGAIDLATTAGTGDHIVCTKGSVDGLMEICSHVIVDGTITSLSEKIKETILTKTEKKASNGIRVLGMAYRLVNESQSLSIAEEEKELVFIGMCCMVDPVRPEAIEAVRMSREAGVRVVMITGDHPLTAHAIGHQLGLTENDTYLTGKDLTSMSHDELKESIRDVCVFARVSPEHKMIIIDALQEAHEIVSMTGDGVNDAPALKSADIGVAMGITGTDVSKEASDMVLLDDNFATIVAAIKEGRTIFDNIRKFITYILTGNLGEILIMLLGPFFGLPLPLLPIQILWINLVTDGAPAIALGYEEAEKDVMCRPPFASQEGIFSRGIGKQILLFGSITGMMSIVIGFIAYKSYPESNAWQTMIFTTIAFCQISLAMSLRKTNETIFSKSFFSNIPMLMAVALTTVLQLIIIYNPFFNGIFKTTPLSFAQISVCIGASVLIVILIECKKFMSRK